MRRAPLNRGKALDRTSATLRRFTALGRGNGLPRKGKAAQAGTGGRRATPISSVTPAQRRKVRAQGCIVCGPSHDDFTCGPIDPAHVIPRSLLTEGQDEPLAVVGLGRRLHDRYDRREQPFLDLLPLLQGSPELDFAIERFGYSRTIWRVSNTRPT